MSEDLRFPVGEFDETQEVTPEKRQQFIQTIADLPAKINSAVKYLNDEQLDTQYRPEGWTIRQVVHHVADSHLNSLCRFKLGLSEETPTIKPYNEAQWAEMADSKNAPIEISLKIIEGVHARWALLLNAMSEADYRREIYHPERGTMSLSSLLAMYEWHCRHHTAHITQTRTKNNW